MEQIETFLAGLPFFKNLPLAQLTDLVTQSQVRTYNTGDVIVGFGDSVDIVGVLVAGEAEEIATAKGKRARLRLVKPGDLFGEVSILTGEPSSSRIVALGKSDVLLIPHHIFSSYLTTDPIATRQFADSLTTTLRTRQQDEDALARIEQARCDAVDPHGLSLCTISQSRILVINCGSSSLKFSYFDTDGPSNNVEGNVERIGLGDSYITSSSQKGDTRQPLGSVDHQQAFQAVISLLTRDGDGTISHPEDLTAVGHRVVHGGDKYESAVLIDGDVLDEIRKNSVLAPLHNPPSLNAIEASMKLLPGVPQVAVFDTGFHQKMPAHAYLYGLPYDYYENEHIRRYGFHGISHQYVALKAAAYLRRDFRETRIISCHLGNGASVCAIDHGRSIDTSMGLTPLEGLIMGTRSGDLDPSVVFYLYREKHMSIDEIEDLLNRQSGLKGISGVTNDFRDLENAADRGEVRAILAINAFCYRVRKYIGAYVAALGGADVLIFTGGIGEGSAWVRASSCQGLSCSGIQLDDVLNRTASPAAGEPLEISGDDSAVKVLVVPTDEARMIAREAIRVIEQQQAAKSLKKQADRPIPIEVSAHHVHLSTREVDVLFGTGHKLTRKSDISQPGQYACVETVDLVGPRGTVPNVRLVGPERSEAQVEISRTEEFKLGIKAPVRRSGDLHGSPGIRLQTPNATCDISNGVICALRHIHMSPQDALTYGLKDGDTVMVRVEGERALMFGDVVVRVHPDFSLAMHIDTDEANAAEITTGASGYLIGVQERR